MRLNTLVQDLFNTPPIHSSNKEESFPVSLSESNDFMTWLASLDEHGSQLTIL